MERPQSFAMKSKICLIFAVAVLLLALVGYWAFRPGVRGIAERPNVVVIIMDTARQDALSTYGYSRETSPNLSVLATQSRTYLNAYATSTWTSPSHASLFTGLYPVAHGCTQENWVLSHHLVTLAELLSAGGYETVGIVENPILAKGAQFDQGFAQYHEMWKIGSGAPGATTSTTISLFNRTLDERDKSKPLFVFVNVIGPHSPYDSSGRFMDRFVTDPTIELNSNLWRLHYLGQKTFAPAELRHLRQLYDAELLAVDDAVGKMVDALRRRELLDDTILVVASDHGENIGDHGHMDHVFSLYQTTVKVPLLIRAPSWFTPNSRHEGPVQLTDIPPTILGIVGLDSPEVRFQGHNLLEGRANPDRVILCEYYKPVQATRAMRGVITRANGENLRRYDRRLRAVIRHNLKLIWGSDGLHELYDLNRDPNELHNLLDQPEYAAAQKDLLGALMAATAEYVRAPSNEGGDARGILDKKTRDALRSLGYLD